MERSGFLWPSHGDHRGGAIPNGVDGPAISWGGGAAYLAGKGGLEDLCFLLG